MNSTKFESLPHCVHRTGLQKRGSQRSGFTEQVLLPAVSYSIMAELKLTTFWPDQLSWEPYQFAVPSCKWVPVPLLSQWKYIYCGHMLTEVPPNSNNLSQRLDLVAGNRSQNQKLHRSQPFSVRLEIANVVQLSCSSRAIDNPPIAMTKDHRTGSEIDSAEAWPESTANVVLYYSPPSSIVRAQQNAAISADLNRTQVCFIGLLYTELDRIS